MLEKYHGYYYLIWFWDDFLSVCALVGKRCKMIMLPFTECIFTYKDIDYAGRGKAKKNE